MSSETVTNLIRTFVSAVADANPGEEIGIILIGSVARGVATAQSDLDLLVVTENQIKRPKTPDTLHVQLFTRVQFIERLSTGDDFAAWCVRFGVPIIDTPVWSQITLSEEARIWPSWQLKVSHVLRRLLLANDLRGLNDFDAATEELLYAVSHVSRALLLRAGIFPLSRPEMIAQLKELGYPSLSKVLEGLLFRDVSTRVVDRGIKYVKKLAISLDREQYRRHVDARRTAAAAKRRIA